MNSRFNVISLFAGCGGSSLGYQLAGGKVLLAVEWLDEAVATYRLNFPDTQVYHGDIKDLTVKECLSLTGLKLKELYVLDGSPPCQGFSTAGRRQLEDPRNTLFKEYVRLLRGLKPKVFVMENVSGLLKGQMKWAFAEIMKELKASGYNVKCRLMNAKYYGVPQVRKRVIFIGVRKDLCTEPSYPVPQTRPITMREAIGDLPAEQDPSIGHTWLDESPAGRNTKTYRLALRAQPGEKYAGTQKRMLWNAPAPTLLKPGTEIVTVPPYLRNSNCHPSQTRTLSLLEMKRLSSFPEDFQFPDYVKGYYQLGNCVPPLLMKAVAEHVRDEILKV